MPTANSRPPARFGWRVAALIYTVTGVTCVLACAAVPESEAGLLAAVLGGLPWSMSLLTLDLSPGVANTALMLLAGSWTINAALLWWLALRRPTHHGPSHPA
ncbi:hypothetical protein AB4142_14850 [Variovorax sp. 2RAF20]|jgi:hypothetical protein